MDELRGDLSDHAPIITELKVEIHSNRINKNNQQTGTPLSKLKWAEGAPEIFREEFETAENKIKLDEIKQQLAKNPGRADIEDAVQKLTAILITTTEKAGKFTKIRKQKQRKKRRNKLWYDKDCEEARKEVRQLGKKVQKGDENKRGEFYKARKTHKKLLKWKMKQFKKKS